MREYRHSEVTDGSANWRTTKIKTLLNISTLKQLQGLQNREGAIADFFYFTRSVFACNNVLSYLMFTLFGHAVTARLSIVEHYHW